ncbi:conserved hypothetical protein [Thermobaculum terrenum ATCC BAA-798]|uniref:HNH endonuclease n=1 Tax=Thermobaculum terrenum (strain ATCC BAA-798 / CCMEE 7001 / YNP1) TaxID=525904 RepID=D1CHB7_THET1|nr:hypothetical protein [Thermobaculum terrenum]ACZ43138.1 conserved hypothetical protein [Thermobaculum terrenum ATCC BAA-798]
MLTVELVPSTSWGSNLRSILTPAQWDEIRREAYARAGHRCTACGRRGRLEAHEVWEYDDDRRIQRLVDVAALCHDCHMVVHWGYASTRGLGDRALRHLARVNGWSLEDARLYLEAQLELWARRSRHPWQLDLSWLEARGIEPPHSSS